MGYGDHEAGYIYGKRDEGGTGINGRTYVARVFDKFCQVRIPKVEILHSGAGVGARAATRDISEGILA